MSKPTSTGIAAGTFLIFECHGEQFATPLLGVREIVETPEIQPVPYSKEHYLGIVNIRGGVISVIDLAKKLQMKTAGKPWWAGFIMVLDLPGTRIGMRVDRVVAVRKLSPEEMSEAPMLDDSLVDRRFLIGAARHANRLVTLFDLQKLITEEELQLSQRQAS